MPLAWSGVLDRGPDLAVAVTGAAVFSSGVRLDIAVRARTSRGGAELFHSVAWCGCGHRSPDVPDGGWFARVLDG